MRGYKIISSYERDYIKNVFVTVEINLDCINNQKYFFFKQISNVKLMNPKPHPFKTPIHHHHTDFDDGSAAPTYLITPSFTCQNPSHSHHLSHFPPCYRQHLVDTVVEESTGGSIVTVIDANRSGCADNDRIQMPPPPAPMDLPPPLLSSTPITKARIPSPVQPSPSPSPTPSMHSDTVNVDDVDDSDAMQSNDAGTELFTQTKQTHNECARLSAWRKKQPDKLSNAKFIFVACCV